MKKDRLIKSLANEFPTQVIDQSAETVNELAALTGRHRRWIVGFARQQIKLGRWEKVLKQVNSRLIPAYRRIK